MSHARAASLPFVAAVAILPSWRFVRFGLAVHHRKSRTTLCCTSWPDRADERSLHVKRAAGAIASSSRCHRLCSERQCMDGQNTGQSYLVTQVAQYRLPTDPRYGWYTRRQTPRKAWVSGHRCNLVIDRHRHRRQISAVQRWQETQNPARNGRVSPVPEGNSRVHVVCEMGSNTNRPDRHQKAGAKNTLPEH